MTSQHISSRQHVWRTSWRQPVVMATILATIRASLTTHSVMCLLLLWLQLDCCTSDVYEKDMASGEITEDKIRVGQMSEIWIMCLLLILGAINIPISTITKFGYPPSGQSDGSLAKTPCWQISWYPTLVDTWCQTPQGVSWHVDGSLSLLHYMFRCNGFDIFETLHTLHIFIQLPLCDHHLTPT